MSKFSTLPPIPPSRENPALTVNLIFLANKPTPDPIIQHLKESIISGCLLNWNTDFTKINLPRCSKCTGLYANKAQKIKSAYHCTYRQVSDLKVLLLKQFLQIAVTYYTQFQCICRNNKTVLIKQNILVLKLFLMVEAK